MKTIHYIVLGLILSGGGILLLQQTGIIRQPTAEEKQRLKFEDHIKKRYGSDLDQVKATGKNRIRTVSESVPVLIGTLDEVTDQFSLARVKVLDKETSVFPNGNIRTWYKVDLVEFEHKQDKIGEAPLPDNVPSRFLPLLPTESLLFIDGGEMDVDGVHIEQILNDNIVLKLGAEYLVAVDVQSEGKLLFQIANSEGIYQVEEGKLKPLCQSSHDLVRDIDRKYGNDLNRMRSAIQSRKTQKK